ncbi:MAG: gliding motility-associated C-terminal domain-containing protein [Bacteroidetes bacterium]|nr:gliding motility-associated C-terminal domain-containing protein [Bacteroidota bacterium]
MGDSTITIEQNPEHSYLKGGLYEIQLITTNDVGCTDTLIKELDIESFVTAYIPNSFTPNDDGKNDVFGLIGFPANGYSMVIYNRWGQIVFESVGAFDTWNGKSVNGSAVPLGVYSYFITIKNDKAQKPITGTVSLIR